MLAKLLLRTQEIQEECETLLRQYLSEEDIKQLASQHSPIKDPGGATVASKYIHAVCEHKLKSFCCLVGQPLLHILVTLLTALLSHETLRFFHVNIPAT